MSFKLKFENSIKAATPNNELLKAKYKSYEDVPDDAKFWNREDLLRNSEFVTIKACNERRRKDGSVFYSLILEDLTEVNTDNPCTSGVAQIVTIPAGTFTMKFDGKEFSKTEVMYRDRDYTRVLGAGVLTYGMKLKQQIAEKIITVAAIADK